MEYFARYKSLNPFNLNTLRNRGGGGYPLWPLLQGRSLLHIITGLHIVIHGLIVLFLRLQLVIRGLLLLFLRLLLRVHLIVIHPLRCRILRPRIRGCRSGLLCDSYQG
jgi:hypothetical protein